MKDLVILDNLRVLDDMASGLISLCCRCFKVDKNRASYIMSKFFEHGNNHSAIGLVDGRVVSFYGVLVSSFAEEKFAISVNTMSDGTMKQSTTYLGSSLYRHLLNNYAVKTVIGFPNKNIINQRIRFLGWEYITDLQYAFVGYPRIYYDWYKNYSDFEHLNINLPIHLKKNTLAGVPLYSPNSNHINFSLMPGLISFDIRHDMPWGSLRIPKVTKKLCVKSLDKDSQLYTKLKEGSVFLSHDSIDVP